MPRVRLFIAIDVPPEICQQLAQIQEQIKQSNIIEGSFARPEQLHVTLKFIGEADENLVPEIVSRLNTITLPSFTTELNKLGYFVTRHREPILWVSLEPSQMPVLAQYIENALADILPRTTQAFANHVTLVRAKRIIDQDKFTDFVRDFKIGPQIPFWVTEFVLKSSITYAAGAEHTIIERFSLNV